VIRVAVTTVAAPEPRAFTAASIREALGLAGGPAAGARVLFPIEPEAFFVREAPYRPNFARGRGSGPAGTPARRKAAV
jgi:hypothetical protein